MTYAFFNTNSFAGTDQLEQLDLRLFTDIMQINTIKDLMKDDQKICKWVVLN